MKTGWSFARFGGERAFTAAVVIVFLAAALAMPRDPALNKTMSYHSDIVTLALENQDFRRVLFTGPKSQLVVMSIPPGGDVGEETHLRTEQTLFFVSGTGAGLLDGETFPIEPGTVVVVTPGTRHNFRNTGPEDLKLYTVYAPPNHIKERVHHTKADADADAADEAFGEGAP